jgi:hypothetical protein
MGTFQAHGKSALIPCIPGNIGYAIYRERNNMRIDAAMPQPQRINEMAVQPQKEVAGEREPDGDADDAVRTAAKNPPAQQINPQGVGNKVDLLA